MPIQRQPKARKAATPSAGAASPVRAKKSASRKPADDDMALTVEPDFPGNDSFGLMLRMALFGLRRSFKDELAEVGVPWAMWYYLRVLWARDGLSQKELTKWVGMLQPNAAGTIQAMQEMGLVRIERELADRRRIRIWLTPHGRELMDELLPKIRSRIDSMVFSDFKAEERQQLLALLARACANISASNGG